MKRLIIFALLLVSMTAGAQYVETLSLKQRPADPLAGTTAHRLWIGQHVAITENVENADDWELTIFNIETVFPDRANTQTKLGFYTEQDSLVFMVDGFRGEVSSDSQRMGLWYSTLDDSIPNSRPYRMNYTRKKYDYRFNIKNLTDYMLTHNGYVRVLAFVYGDKYKDIRFRLQRKEE